MQQAPPDFHHNEIQEAGKTHDELLDYSVVPKGESHYRMCYYRIAPDDYKWRLRDERGGVKSLWLVKEYVGQTALNWLDHGSHVFTDNPVWIDPDTRVAHFYQLGKPCICGKNHNE